MDPQEFDARVAAIVGRETEPQAARDPVNQPMIRHWCDAVDDRNAVYTDEERARASVHGGIVAPPAMLQAWVMPGLRRPAPQPSGNPIGKVLSLLDEAGYTSVVATNCRQEYARYLVPGDRVEVVSRVEKVSEEKQTMLGVGRFFDQVMLYRDQRGDEVARMTFRILKFKPGTGRVPTPTPSGDAPKTAVRPRPAVGRENAFFWEAVREGRLEIQRCTGCGALRHPPGPMCPSCHALEWDTVRASGRGRVYSFVVAHHPAVPPFAYPNCIVLVELEEGTRLVSNLVDIDPKDVEIGLPVEVAFTEVDPELVLPLFRPSNPR